MGAWRSGLRSRGVQVLLFLGFVVAASAWLAAAFSGRQPETVAIDVGISGIRILGALLILFWIQDLISRDIERKTVYLVLAYPSPRGTYLLGRFLGVMGLTLAAVLLFSILLLFTQKSVALEGYQQSTAIHLGWPYVLTFAYVLLDLCVVAAFTLLVAALSTTPMLPFFVGAAFVLAARTLGIALQYLLSGDSGADRLAPTYQPILEALQWVLPDLGRLDIRAGVLYGHFPPTHELIFAAGHAATYAAMFLAAAVLVFRRREFS